MKGLLQERNPFLSIYLPKLFKERYLSEYIEFKKNSHKLITPMDLHKTLFNLIDLETNSKKNDKHQRSLSLFSSIPNQEHVMLQVKKYFIIDY
jgi:hypothetical protein